MMGKQSIDAGDLFHHIRQFKTNPHFLTVHWFFILYSNHDFYHFIWKCRAMQRISYICMKVWGKIQMINEYFWENSLKSVEKFWLNFDSGKLNPWFSDSVCFICASKTIQSLSQSQWLLLTSLRLPKKGFEVQSKQK